MTPENLLHHAIDPGLAFMASVIGPKPSVTPEARVILLAIAGQEGGFKFRRQVPIPYARSYWQFEHGGGVIGVLMHKTAGPFARAICDALDIPSTSATVHEAMAWNDHLAVAMARLLLWTSPHALPALGAGDAAWNEYLGLWRPGKPHPEAWSANYSAAMTAVGATP